MNLGADDERRDAERFLAGEARASRVTIAAWRLLSGGAIQQNLALDVDVADGPHAGRRQWVLRQDAPSAVASSLGRDQEFALLVAAHAAGVVVPRPLFLHPARGGASAWFVMERVRGDAAAHRLTKPGALPDPEALARDLGANLARIHTIRPPREDLAFLGAASATPTRDLLLRVRAYLDHWREAIGDAWPALEWGVHRRLAQAGPDERVVLCHRDFRTGNYMVDEGRLTGILDWEFAGWGHPLEDLGWFCARCWRFAQPDSVAGGIADAAPLLDGYNAVAGTRYTEADTRPWQALAHIRWAVIALQQAERHLAGGERSLELALTGRLLPELEVELLALTAP